MIAAETLFDLVPFVHSLNTSYADSLIVIVTVGMFYPKSHSYITIIIIF